MSNEWKIEATTLASIDREIQTYFGLLRVHIMSIVRGLAGLYSLICQLCVAFLFVFGLHATEMVVLWAENLQILVV